MRSDSDYRKLDAKMDELIIGEKERIKTHWKRIFENMTLEEKIDFLLEEFIENKASKS